LIWYKPPKLNFSAKKKGKLISNLMGSLLDFTQNIIFSNLKCNIECGIINYCDTLLYYIQNFEQLTEYAPFFKKIRDAAKKKFKNHYLLELYDSLLILKKNISNRKFDTSNEIKKLEQIKQKAVKNNDTRIVSFIDGLLPQIPKKEPPKNNRGRFNDFFNDLFDDDDDDFDDDDDDDFDDDFFNEDSIKDNFNSPINKKDILKFLDILEEIGGGRSRKRRK